MDFLKSRKFYDSNYSKCEEQKMLSEFVKKEKLVPFLLQMLILDKIFTGRELKGFEFFDTPEVAMNLVSLTQDFPAYFNYTRSKKNKNKKRKYYDSDMTMWNLLMDINMLSQAPIQFTQQTYQNRLYHILQVFFRILESQLKSKDCPFLLNLTTRMKTKNSR